MFLCVCICMCVRVLGHLPSLEGWGCMSVMETKTVFSKWRWLMNQLLYSLCYEYQITCAMRKVNTLHIVVSLLKVCGLAVLNVIVKDISWWSDSSLNWYIPSFRPSLPPQSAMITVSPTNTADFDHVMLAVNMSSLPDDVTSEYDVSNGSKFTCTHTCTCCAAVTSLEWRSHLTNHFFTLVCLFLTLCLSRSLSLTCFLSISLLLPISHLAQLSSLHWWASLCTWIPDFASKCYIWYYGWWAWTYSERALLHHFWWTPYQQSCMCGDWNNASQWPHSRAQSHFIQPIVCGADYWRSGFTWGCCYHWWGPSWHLSHPACISEFLVTVPWYASIFKPSPLSFLPLSFFLSVSYNFTLFLLFSFLLIS